MHPVKTTAVILILACPLGACTRSSDYRTVMEYCAGIRVNDDYQAVERFAREHNLELGDETVISTSPYRVNSVLRPTDTFRRSGCSITHDFKRVYAAEYNGP